MPYARAMRRGRGVGVAVLGGILALASACGEKAPAGGARSADGRQWRLANDPAASASASATATTFARRALMIGNAKYEKTPLKNPPSDVELLGAELTKAGFASVVTKKDLTLRQMQDAVTEFRGALGVAEMGVVFYAGHGVEIQGKNYLVPIDFAAETTEAQAPDRAYSLDRMLDLLRSGRRGPSIVILDACRNNPFLGRRGGGGLADVDLPEQTAVWFSTSTKQVAADGDGQNSPFTAALVGALARGASRPLQIFQLDVKAEVMRSASQRPILKENLDGPYAFGGAVEAPAAAAAAPASTPGAPASRALLVGVEDYQDPQLAKVGVKTQRDVSAMKKALGHAGYGEISTVEGARATGAAIREALAALRRSVRAGDRVAFYFAGLASRVDGKSAERDGRDEALFPSDASPSDRRTVIVDDELASALHDLRRAAGPSGHVLVAIDAYRLFDDGVAEISPAPASDLAPITLLQPPVDKAFESASVANKAGVDAVGLLTRGLATALEGALPDEPFRALVGAMRAATESPDAFALEGEIDVAVGTGAPTIRGAFLPVNRSATYGPTSLYLEAGRFDGVASGAEVDVYAAPTRTTQARAIGHGVVMQAGKRWARVELERPVAEPGPLWALPVARAMPDVPLRVVLDPSVVTERAALQATLATIASPTPGKRDALELRVVEQGAYFYVQTAAKKTVAGPLAKAEGVLAVAHHVWRQAYLASLRAAQGTQRAARVTVTAGGRGACQTGRHVTVGAYERDTPLEASSAGEPRPAGRTRGLVLDVENPLAASALLLTPVGVKPVAGLERFVGGGAGCVPLPDPEARDLELLVITRQPDWRTIVAALDERPSRVVPRRPDEVPLAAIPVETRRWTERADQLDVDVARVPAASSATPSRDSVDPRYSQPTPDGAKTR